MLALPVLLAGCASETTYGACVGLNGHERADRVYEYSARNIVVGVLFFGLVAPPVIVALNELKCPVAVKAPDAVPSRVAP